MQNPMHPWLMVPQPEAAAAAVIMGVGAAVTAADAVTADAGTAAGAAAAAGVGPRADDATADIMGPAVALARRGEEVPAVVALARNAVVTSSNAVAVVLYATGGCGAGPGRSGREVGVVAATANAFSGGASTPARVDASLKNAAQ